jgi:hypothetical protein
MIAHLRAIPDKIQWILDNQDDIKRCADKPKYRDAQSALFSAAATTSRARSKARSSSRKSATSTPKAMPPAK